jgi:hypothetical protein
MSFEPDDYELGEDVSDQFIIEPRNAGSVIAVHLDAALADRLFAAARAEGITIIEYVRLGLVERLDRAASREKRRTRVSA